MVPTRRFWLLVALGIPIAAIGALAGVPMLAVVWNVLLIAAAFVTYRLGPDARHLRLTRRHDSVLSVRAQNPIVLELENDGVEPVRGRLRDEPPPAYHASQREFDVALAPGKTTQFEYLLTPLERGAESFKGTWVRLHCPMGLVEKQAVLPTEEAFRVYPNVLALREFDLLRQQGRLRELGLRQSRNRGLGTEFESLREYAEGDDYRKIDHKATARRGKIMVRQFEQERNQSVLICVDTGRLMLNEVDGVKKLDLVLDSILMLAHATIAAGDLVGLLVYADRVVRYVPPRKGKSQVALVIDTLHDLVAEPVETDLVGAFGYLSTRWKRRSLLVNFTDVDDPDRAKVALTALTSAARRNVALTVRIQDPEHDQIVHAAPTSAEKLYQKAAVDAVMADRREARAILEAAGIHVLDTEPQDLAAKLVSYYFMVKERSLL